jgi:hypothetical protein
MSKTIQPASQLSPESFGIIKIIANHAHTFKALAANSADTLDPTTLYTQFVNTINLTGDLHFSNNFTVHFMVWVTEAEDLTLKCNTTVAKHNMLNAQHM